MSEEENGYDESQDVPPEEPQEEAWDGLSQPEPRYFSDYDLYVKCLIDWQIKQAGPGVNPQAIAQAVRQGLQPQVSPRDRFEAAIIEQAPDDELLPGRQEAIDWIEECRHKEHEAKIRGDVNAERDWQQRAQWGVQRIKELGKSKAEQYSEEVHEDLDERAIKSALLNPDRADEKIWDSPKMRHDSAIVVIRANQRSKSGTIRLPAESSPWGSVLDCHPKHMMEVTLPPSQYESWRDSVYHSGINEGDHAALFRKSWSCLRKLGFGDSATPVIKSKPVDPDSTDDPAQMSWKRYVAWREETESKKRNRAVIFPKRKR